MKWLQTSVPMSGVRRSEFKVETGKKRKRKEEKEAIQSVKQNPADPG